MSCLWYWVLAPFMLTWLSLTKKALVANEVYGSNSPH